MIIDAKTEHIENMVDQHLEEIFVKKEEIKLLCGRVELLELAIPEIKASFKSGDERMERIESSQSSMNLGITDILHTLKGVNGIKGVVELLQDGITESANVKTWIDNFNGVLKVSAKIGVILAIISVVGGFLKFIGIV